jgi:hypothetical protein
MSETETLSHTLGTEYPKEQARLVELVEQYKEIGPAGQFGLHMIKQVLKRSYEAAISNDVVEMLKVFREMQGCQ